MSKVTKKSLSRRVFAATSIFGGVQAISIICSLVRNKFIALIIGQAGIGLFAMLNATISLITASTQLGVFTSSVRTLAETSESRNQLRLLKLIKATKRWGWLLGLFGMIVTIAVSPLLSTTIFNNNTLWPFVFVALIILFNSVQEADKAIMQALGHLNPLARASIWGSIGGTLVTLPAIYFWHLNGVAPALLAFSAFSTAAIAVSSHKYVLDTSTVKQSLKETYHLGKSFVSLGIFLMISSLLTYAASYVFLALLNRWSDMETVGIYQAGYTISMNYITLIFSAIGMEYYPRLAKAAAHGSYRMQVFMRHENSFLLIPMLIAGTVIAAAATFIVKLLYSADFLDAVPMILLALPALAFRSASWCASFTLIAADKGRIYLFGEVTGVLIMLICNIAGFKLGGIGGIGISFIVYYLIYFLLSSALAGHYTKSRWSAKSIAGIFLTAAAILSVCMCALCGFSVSAAVLAAIFTAAGIIALYRQL